MPVNNFTVGKDITIVVQMPTGQLTLSGITDFSAKPVYTDLKSKGLDGITRHGTIPDGWNITLKVDRFSPELDNWCAAQEAGYFAGNNQKAGTIYETIQEADGSITQWRFTGVILKLDNAGDFAGDKKVEQSLSGNATRRIKVA